VHGTYQCPYLEPPPNFPNALSLLQTWEVQRASPMDGNGDGPSSHRHHPRFASLCIVVPTIVLAPIDGASIIATLIVVMQQQHFPPCLYSSCYYSYCVSKDKTTKR